MTQKLSSECVFSKTIGDTALFSCIEKLFAFDEFTVHKFLIGAEKKPRYTLIVGNPNNKEYYNKIALNTIHMIGLCNLVSLIENVLNNAIHYQELVIERELLEIKVDQRTDALNNALNNLKDLNNKLEILSFQDELTGLYNRRGFFIFGEKFFSMAKRKNCTLVIFYCDLDKFKSINDLYGHKEGDFALKTSATILKNACRDYDIISRFGGDEFVILLDNFQIDDVEEFKIRITTLFHDYNSHSNKGYQISISCGYTEYSPIHEKNVTFGELIERADKKLYLEKGKRQPK
jgi:diguanylate cyclase (GGDEF)-like protein